MVPVAPHAISSSFVSAVSLPRTARRAPSAGGMWRQPAKRRLRFGREFACGRVVRFGLQVECGKARLVDRLDLQGGVAVVVRMACHCEILGAALTFIGPRSFGGVASHPSNAHARSSPMSPGKPGVQRVWSPLLRNPCVYVASSSVTAFCNMPECFAERIWLRINAPKPVAATIVRPRGKSEVLDEGKSSRLDRESTFARRSREERKGGRPAIVLRDPPRTVDTHPKQVNPSAVQGARNRGGPALV